jgi:hypothetical protein
MLVVSCVALFLGSFALLGRARPPLLERMASAALLAVVLPIGVVEVLGHVGALRPPWVLGLSLAIALVMFACGARSGLFRAAALVGRALFGGWFALGSWVGVASVVLAADATYRLRPWAWDALGYHLPLVHHALTVASLQRVPTHVVYVNVYPHLVDVYFVWWRALLADDTWIELAQLPFAVLGVLSIACMAARRSVAPPRALALSALWLAIPNVALQLATNYVDVAFAALLVASVEHATRDRGGRTTQLLCGLALGVFLACKPSAPLPFVLLGGALLLLRRARAVAPLALAVCIGAPTYVENLLRYGNPIWPVRVDVGPLHLPGLEAPSHLYEIGLPEQVRRHGWLGRLLLSWFHAPSSYIYDMRLGGFGPLFLLLLACAALVLAKKRLRRSMPRGTLLLALAALATPAAFLPRYTFALPALLLAVYASATARVRRRGALDFVLAATACICLFRAAPGFFAEGRAGVDGHEALWAAARAKVGPGEAFGYDASFPLPGQLRRNDGRSSTVFVEDPSSVLTRHVRIAALRPENAARVELLRPARVHALFRCPLGACTVYEIEP